MGNTGSITHDLTARAPGQALIERLLVEHERGTISFDAAADAADIDDSARGWYWGVLGERRVAQILSGLTGATVLHSVPIGPRGTDVDHVVISPAGVFTINTKYSPGAKVWTAGYGLRVNGTPRARYLQAAAREASRVTDLLSIAAGFAVPVHPLIVFVAPSKLQNSAPNVVDGTVIRVCDDKDLLTVLNARRELSDEQTARIVEVARSPWTWSKSVKPFRPGEQLSREFDALREAVGPALDATRVRPLPRRQPVPVAPDRRRRGVVGIIAAVCLGVVGLPLLALLVITSLANALMP